MDSDIVDYYGMLHSKYARTVRAVTDSMSQYGISRPLTTEYRNYFNNLPKTPVRQQVEVLRQMKCSKFPQSEHEVAGKLNELYVFCDVAKTLESDAITLAVKKCLKALENEFPPPGKRKSVTHNLVTTGSDRKMTKAMEVAERTRKDLDKYSRVGEIKKKLYSMPEYVRDRDRKGIKLPEIKLKSPSFHSDLNISRVRGVNTKMGRVIVKKEAKRKKMEDLKQMLNPFGKKLKLI